VERCPALQLVRSRIIG